MKQRFWLLLVFALCFAQMQEVTGQCEYNKDNRKGSCRYICGDHARGNLDFSIQIAKDGVIQPASASNVIDFSKAKSDNSYIKVLIRPRRGNNAIIHIEPVHVRKLKGFQDPKITGSGTELIEIIFYYKVAENYSGDVHMHIEYVPFLEGVNYQNRSLYVIQRVFKIIAPQTTAVQARNEPTATNPTPDAAKPAPTNLEKIKSLIAKINNGNAEPDTRSKLKSLCYSEFNASKTQNDWERFLSNGELGGCSLCGENFDEMAMKLIPGDDGSGGQTTNTSTGEATTIPDDAATKTQSTKIGAPAVPEPKAWAKANKYGGSIKSYEEYLKIFPKGAHADEAKTQIATIKEKDRIAGEELDNELNKAANDCALKLEAYDRYLKKQPVAHFINKRATANSKKKELLRICGESYVSLIGETTPKEGELRLTYFNRKAKPEDIKISVMQRDIEQVIGQDVFLDPVTNNNSGQFEWILSEVEGGETKVKVVAQGTGNTTEETFVMPVRPSHLDVDREKEIIHVIGGEHPLYLTILHNGVLQDAKPRLTSRWLNINTSEYFKEPGKYSIMVTDDADVKIGDTFFVKGGDFSMLEWLIAIVVVASLTLFALIFRRQIIEWMRTKPALRNLFRLKSPEALRTQGLEGAKILHDQGSIKVRSQQLLQQEERKTAGKIVIKRADGQPPAGAGVAALPAFMESEKYKEFDLRALWGDSIVHKVFMRIDAAAELDNQLHELAYRMDKQNGEDKQPHPEIGGFLLGQHFKGEHGYYVSLEKYVEAPTEKQDAYEIEFGQEAFARLDEVKEKHKDLDLVGWFHTHPGHGCFLSAPDQKIQNGFFREPYQMAFQIDTLSDKMDFAIYSWQYGGLINNAKDKIASAWFSWETVNHWRKDFAKRLL